MWPPFTNPGRTYKFYTGKPVLPFGYGLSYSRFTYTIVPELSLSQVSLKQRALRVLGHITVNVTNAGNVDADEVVLGFISPPAANGRPLKQLFEFTRVHVKAGQTATGGCSDARVHVCAYHRAVALPLAASSVTLVDENGLRCTAVCLMDCLRYCIVFVCVCLIVCFHSCDDHRRYHHHCRHHRCHCRHQRHWCAGTGQPEHSLYVWALTEGRAVRVSPCPSSCTNCSWSRIARLKAAAASAVIHA